MNDSHAAPIAAELARIRRVLEQILAALNSPTSRLR